MSSSCWSLLIFDWFSKIESNIISVLVYKLIIRSQCRCCFILVCSHCKKLVIRQIAEQLLSVIIGEGRGTPLNRPIPHTTKQTTVHVYAYRQFTMASKSNMRVSGLWEVTCAPGENPRRLKSTTCTTPHRKAERSQLAGGAATFSLWSTTAPQCHLYICIDQLNKPYFSQVETVPQEKQPHDSLTDKTRAELRWVYPQTLQLSLFFSENWNVYRTKIIHKEYFREAMWTSSSVLSVYSMDVVTCQNKSASIWNWLNHRID